MLLLLTVAATAFARPLKATLDPSSTVTYTGTDPLETWQATAPVASLKLTLDDTDLSQTTLEVTVEPRRFDSGNYARDENGRRTVFETDSFPTSSFDLRAIEGDKTNLPDGGERKLTCAGDLTLHGTTRRIAVPVTVTRKGQQLSASGSFRLSLTDFGMHRPSVLFVTVDDTVTVTIHVVATLP